jgi:succinoglycan biosynthesis transport protein ExoP
MSASEPEATPASLGELGLCLWHARWTLGAWMLVGVLLAGTWAALSQPRFTASATILIEQESSPGLLGDLAMLASIASAPATASELSVLESRTLAERVVDEGVDASGEWNPRDERNLGLGTVVDDESLRPLSLLRRKLFETRPLEVPLVLPERGVYARVTHGTVDAPTRIRLEFLDSTRVRLSRAGPLAELHLGARDFEEHAFVPHEPLAYQGLELELEPWGDYAGASFVLEHLPQNEALRRLQDNLSVRETALNSGVIEVELEDTDPRRAARSVNALCQHYLDSLAARGKRRASKTVDYVQGLLEEEFANFQKNQDVVMRLQKENPELISPEGAATSLIEQMAGLEVERIQLELSERAFTEIVAALEAGDRRALARIDSTLNVGVLVDPITTGMLTELARLEATGSSLGTDLLEGHPLLTRNEEASADLLRRTREQLQSRLTGIAGRKTEIEGIQAQMRGQLAEMPTGMRDMAEARVELGIHRDIVPYLIRSLQGAEITRSSAETLADLVDPAAPPDELGAPNLPLLVALGLLGGLGAGMVVSFVRAPLRERVHRADELAEALGLERVSVLTRLGTRELVFERARASPVAEAIRALRGLLRFAPDGSVRRSVGLTSLGGDDSAGALAAELALAFASEGRRTLLVEADFGRPALAARFELEDSPGLAEELEDGGSWPEHVHPAKNGRPDVLLAGKAEVPTGDLLARASAERFLNEARARYDVVVLSLPPLEMLPAAPGLARALDIVCFAHRARTRPRARVVAAARALRATGARNLVGVLVEKRS